MNRLSPNNKVWEILFLLISFWDGLSLISNLTFNMASKQKFM